MMLKGKKILIGVTGSIAAYKIPFLVRLLKKQGAEVQVILTPDAHDFVTPLTLSVLSENPVHTAPFNPEDGSWNSHIELALSADVMLIAPASANTLAKMASGAADNLLLTTWLAARCQVFFAPAMDLDMFRHPATQRNIQSLIGMGHLLISPREGELASGLCGAGRMEEPEAIVGILSDWFKKKSDFSGKRVMISAGPTREPIDPVRFISNYSTGRMGYALALAFAMRGAEVTVVSGPVEVKAGHPAVQVLPVKTAREMFDACIALSPEADIMVMTAAVADFTPVSPASSKIKKGPMEIASLQLRKTEDILATLGSQKRPDQLLIGFALETDNELANAREKLENKKADIIVLNSLKDPGSGFGTSTNKVTILGKDGAATELPLMEKSAVADAILNFIMTM